MGPNWIKPRWPAPPWVRALATTRGGGVSQGPWTSFNLGLRSGDEAAHVAENRRRLGQITSGEPAWLKQVHGVACVQADANAEMEADAAWTSEQRLPCTILTADCLPVLLCDRTQPKVAASHCGWRSLASGVLENTVKAMGSDGNNLLAWLGPCIGPQAFEVGADVYEAFVEQESAWAEHFSPGAPGKWYADLVGLATARLTLSGCTQVVSDGSCTVADPERFFSYRRDGVTGRMATLIWIDSH